MSTDEERRDAYLFYRYVALLESSGLTDVKPLSTSWEVDRQCMSLFVESASRGRVSIGEITLEEVNALSPTLTEEAIALVRKHRRDARAEFFGAVAEYAAELEAKRRKPIEAKQKKARHWIDRTGKLTTDGHSLAQIALKISAERGKATSSRQISEWRKQWKALRDRETADSS